MVMAVKGAMQVIIAWCELPAAHLLTLCEGGQGLGGCHVWGVKVTQAAQDMSAPPCVAP